ncbi:conjugal transfer protein TraX, partial [Salmonella enterica subsp. enterica serovar Newport]|nr:conjugal transfer protein TraX [Salmonella enterica subsp. enterica serovar Newport]
SITRIATRRIINIFVPLMETRLITNSVQHMLKQQKSRLEKFRQVNNKKAQLCLSWEEALLASHMSVDDLDCRFRRRRTAWRLCCWSLLAIALFLSGMLFAASSLPLMTLVRAISTLMLILSGVALCASRALIVTYRLWQLHERKVSEPEQGTFHDFLNDRNGWRNATLIAVTSKQY